MRLQRNITLDGSCKYSLIQHEKSGIIEDGRKNTEHEFFVIKLKDINSRLPLIIYAICAWFNDDDELAKDVFELSKRAGKNSKWCKKPD